MKKIIRSVLYLLSSIAPLRGCLRGLALRGILPIALSKRLPVNTIFKTDLGSGRAFLYGSTATDQIGRYLYWQGSGGGEPETFEFFESKISRAKVFADIGANTGHFTLYACAANPELQAYSFEPVPRVFDALQRNVQLNTFAGRVTCTNSAVGLKDGQVSFHIPFDDIPTSASLNQQGFNDIEGELVETKILRLDTFFKDKPVPDFIKIDVEGFEHEVLEGCAGLFEAGHRPGIILECNPGGPAQIITDLLKPLGYEFLHLTDQGAKHSDEITVDDGSPYRNWAAIHPDVAQKEKAA